MNNQYGMGGQTCGETMGYDIAARIGAGLNADQMHAERVDGYNPLAVIDAYKRKKKILLYEGGKSNSIDELVVEEGLNGVKRVISHLGMRNYKYDISKDREPILLDQSKWMRAPSSGMFQAFIQNGAAIFKGDIFCLLYTSDAADE